MAKVKDSKTAVTDPLEASKISAPLPPAPQPPAPEVPTFLSDPPLPPEEVEKIKALPKVGPKMYRVKATTTISMKGHITKLNAGDIVSEAGYGPGGMAIIFGANVPLEELP